MYVLVVNGLATKYPYAISDLKKDNPQISFPDELLPEALVAWGVYQVAPMPRPLIDSLTQKVVALPPVNINGQWAQQWSIEQLSASEAAANQAAAAQALQGSIVSKTQDRLDTFARTRNYDGILSLCTYATSTVPKFVAEGQYGVEARDATWTKLYEILEEVQTGIRPMPSSFADIEPELPVLQWP